MRLSRKLIFSLSALAVCSAADAADTDRTTGASDAEIAAQVREIRYYVPSGTSPRAWIILLHGSDMTPEQQMAMSGLFEAVTAHSAAIAAPLAVRPSRRGEGTTWNVPEDKAFADDIDFVRRLAERAGGDPEVPVFVIGYSGGARLASLLACRFPSAADGYAMVGGFQHPADQGSCPKPPGAGKLVAIHSEDDPINPYRVGEGSVPPYWVRGIEDSLAGWRDDWNCANPVASPGADWYDYIRFRCERGGSIELHLLRGSGHGWPGAKIPLPAWLGPTEMRLSATDILLQAFGIADRPVEPAE